ncbi:MAG: hypothetical protein U0736_06390 [Gemmataceae bacterium]
MRVRQLRRPHGAGRRQPYHRVGVRAELPPQQRVRLVRHRRVARRHARQRRHPQFQRLARRVRQRHQPLVEAAQVERVNGVDRLAAHLRVGVVKSAAQSVQPCLRRAATKLPQRPDRQPAGGARGLRAGQYLGQRRLDLRLLAEQLHRRPQPPLLGVGQLFRRQPLADPLDDLIDRRRSPPHQVEQGLLLFRIAKLHGGE